MVARRPPRWPVSSHSPSDPVLSQRTGRPRSGALALSVPLSPRGCPLLREALDSEAGWTVLGSPRSLPPFFMRLHLAESPSQPRRPGRAARGQPRTHGTAGAGPTQAHGLATEPWSAWTRRARRGVGWCQSAARCSVPAYATRFLPRQARGVQRGPGEDGAPGLGYRGMRRFTGDYRILNPCIEASLRWAWPWGRWNRPGRTR